MNESTFSLAQIWAQGDGISHAVAIMLALMSLASWSVIFVKAWSLVQLRRMSGGAKQFWHATSFEAGMATLDKVAGPVGESLVLTAGGLAVAIPAVLGYNALVRGNKEILASLRHFAHDLHAYLVTGGRVKKNAPANVHPLPRKEAP